MSAVPSVPSSSVRTAPATVLAAVLFAASGLFIAILAFAFMMAVWVAPAEVTAHPVARAMADLAPILLAVGAIHVMVGAGLLTGVRFARGAAGVVAAAGVALAALEAGLILAGRDPVAAEALDPRRAAQSGLGIVLVIGVAYVAMLLGPIRAARR
jgi:hypothetical protein